MARGFGESLYSYAWTIPALKGFMAEPINAISSLWITFYAWRHCTVSVSSKARCALRYIMANGITALYMHTYLPQQGTSVIAALDFATMIGATTEMSGLVSVNSLQAVTVYTLYNILLYDPWIETTVDILWLLVTSHTLHGFLIKDKARNRPYIVMCLLGCLCQLVDRASLLDDTPSVIWLRTHLPLHALWHVLFANGVVNMIKIQ